MKQERFNTGWEVCTGIIDPFGSLFGGPPPARKVTLPHDAMIEEPRDPQVLGGGQSGFYPAKTYTYTKHFQAPEAWANGQQVLEFEGVMGRTLVYVNDQFAVSHENGYSQFFVDLKPFLIYDKENTIKVVAANSEYATRWYSGSGIYRDVNLHTGGTSWIPVEALRLTTDYIEEDYAVVSVDAKLRTSSPQAKQVMLRISLFELGDLSGTDGCTDVSFTGEAVNCAGHQHPAASGETLVTVSAASETSARLRISVSDPKLWSPDHPQLYLCKAEVLEDGIIVDTAEEEFGIRTLRMDARKGLRINGETVKMRGVCMHHDNGIIGATTLYGAEAFRVRNLKNAGVNAIRSAHHPMGKTLLRICDRFGVMVMDELSDMWNVPKNWYDRAFTFSDHLDEELARLTAKDYNHPCVILYSTGNEIPEIGTPDGRALNRKIVARLHALDSTRYTTEGMNGFLAAAPQLAQYIAKIAAGEIENIEASSGGSDNLNMAMSVMQHRSEEDLASSDLLTEAFEETSGTLDAAGFNYLTSRHELEAVKHPDRVVVGSETFPKDIPTLWEIVERNPHVIGDFTWTGYEYLGEAGIGIFHYNPTDNKWSHYPDRLAYCGDINLNGYRRPASYLRETAYGLRTAPFISVERPEHYGEKYDPNGWKYGDAVDSWTWPGFEGKPVRVSIIAKGDEVELLLNGTPLGRKKIGEEEKLTAYFETVYQPGTLEAVCFTKGQESGRTTLKTAGIPEKLSVQVINPELPADGSGLSLLIVEPVDAEGNVNRSVQKNVTVSVSGAGTLAGFGSANPSCEGSYQDTSWETYDGRVMAAVRSGIEAGTIDVRFTAEGCKDAIVTLKVQ